MNKKLLLIPITLMSCFMGACTYDVKHVGINEILDYSLDSTGYFFIYGLFPLIVECLFHIDH